MATNDEDSSITKLYYEVLGVTKEATEEEIRNAYKIKALRTHPDRNIGRIEAATHQFKKVQEAYAVLSDPREKAEYDKARFKVKPPPPPSAYPKWQNFYENPHGKYTPKARKDTPYESEYKSSYSSSPAPESKTTYGIHIDLSPYLVYPERRSALSPNSEDLDKCFKPDFFSDYSDSQTGFYFKFDEVFKNIANAENDLTAPRFGTFQRRSKADRAFYRFWNSFDSSRDFSEVYQYDAGREASDYVTQAVTEQNLSLAREARIGYTITVMALVDFVHKKHKEGKKVAAMLKRKENNNGGDVDDENWDTEEESDEEPFTSSYYYFYDEDKNGVVKINRKEEDEKEKQMKDKIIDMEELKKFENLNITENFTLVKSSKEMKSERAEMTRNGELPLGKDKIRQQLRPQQQLQNGVEKMREIGVVGTESQISMLLRTNGFNVEEAANQYFENGFPEQKPSYQPLQFAQRLQQEQYRQYQQMKEQKQEDVEERDVIPNIESPSRQQQSEVVSNSPKGRSKLGDDISQQERLSRDEERQLKAAKARQEQMEERARQERARQLIREERYRQQQTVDSKLFEEHERKFHENSIQEQRDERTRQEKFRENSNDEKIRKQQTNHQAEKARQAQREERARQEKARLLRRSEANTREEFARKHDDGDSYEDIDDEEELSAEDRLQNELTELTLLRASLPSSNSLVQAAEQILSKVRDHSILADEKTCEKLLRNLISARKYLDSVSNTTIVSNKSSNDVGFIGGSKPSQQTPINSQDVRISDTPDTNLIPDGLLDESSSAPGSAGLFSDSTSAFFFSDSDRSQYSLFKLDGEIEPSNSTTSSKSSHSSNILPSVVDEPSFVGGGPSINDDKWSRMDEVNDDPWSSSHIALNPEANWTPSHLMNSSNILGKGNAYSNWRGNDSTIEGSKNKNSSKKDKFMPAYNDGYGSYRAPNKKPHDNYQDKQPTIQSPNRSNNEKDRPVIKKEIKSNIKAKAVSEPENRGSNVNDDDWFGAKELTTEEEEKYKQPCLFYLKGICRYGDRCPQLHPSSFYKRAPLTLQDERDKICKLYLAGNCPDGDQCALEHPQMRPKGPKPKKNKNKICKFHLSGKCAQGDQCWMQHPGKDVQIASLKSNRICKFHLAGYCREGAHCSMQHVKDASFLSKKKKENLR